MNKANCAVVVVTFFPDTDVLRHVESLCSLCRWVILVDNTPDGIDTSTLSSDNLLVERFGVNKGLAYALNHGMAMAHKQGIEDIFLLDQDSRLPAGYFKKMLAFKRKMDAVNNRCAFCVPNFFDRNSKTFATFPVITAWKFRHIACSRFDYDMKDGVLIAITSGMLISHARYQDIGAFPSDYFIDFIDNEYSLKAGLKGYFVAVNCNQVLDHSVGARSTHRFLGLTIKPNHHLPVRRYYIARNGIKTAIDFWRQYPSYAALVGLRLAHEMISILVYEKDKKDKIGALFYGSWHALLGEMGEYRKLKNT